MKGNDKNEIKNLPPNPELLITNRLLDLCNLNPESLFQRFACTRLYDKSGQGEVSEVKNIENGKFYVLKLNNFNEESKANQELEIYSELDHILNRSPYVLKCVDLCRIKFKSKEDFDKFKKMHEEWKETGRENNRVISESQVITTDPNAPTFQEQEAIPENNEQPLPEDPHQFANPSNAPIPSTSEQNVELIDDEPRNNQTIEPASEKIYRHVNILLLERCKYSLHDWLNKHRTSKSRRPHKRQLKRWMRQIAEAIVFLHSVKILHRDLKPENIFITENNNIRIADFGLSRIVEDEFIKDNNEDSESLQITEFIMTKKIGTPLYFSPEMASNKPYGLKADIHAIGLIFFAMIHNYNVDTRKKAFDAIRKGNYRYHKNHRELLKKLTNMDPKKRPTAKELLEELLDHSNVLKPMLLPDCDYPMCKCAVM